MADSLQVQYGPICVEDFLINGSTGLTAFAQTTFPVLGLGDGTTVTPLVAAVSDGAAATAGVPVGGVYVCQPVSSFNYLRTRMS